MPVDKGWQKRVEQLLYSMHKTHESTPQRCFGAITQTPDARQLRAILRITQRYPWGADVVLEHLDNVQAETLANLSPAQLSALHTRITAYACLLYTSRCV